MNKYFVKKIRRLVNWWFDVTNKMHVSFSNSLILRVPVRNYKILKDPSQIDEWNSIRILDGFTNQIFDLELSSDSR